MKKYEFTGETKILFGEVKLNRIRATRDTPSHPIGTLGGWIESEDNLSHHGNCWVHGEAYVYGGARVEGNAQVFHMAKVGDNAIVNGYARVYGFSHVCGTSLVTDYSLVYNSATVTDNAILCDRAQAGGGVHVIGNAKVSGRQLVKYGTVSTDLSTDLFASVVAQTNLAPVNGEIIAYKHVRDRLTSEYDPTFQYKIGEWAIADDVDEDPNVSCASGLHASNLTYWSGCGLTKVIQVKILVDDIIAVQHGKIRCRKLFVMGVVDGPVF